MNKKNCKYIEKQRKLLREEKTVLITRLQEIDEDLALLENMGKDYVCEDLSPESIEENKKNLEKINEENLS